MIRKKMPTRKSIIKKLDELEAEHSSVGEPFIAFIGKLPDGRYEVVEHIGVGVKKGNGSFKSARHETKIINDKEEYLANNRSGVIIHGEEDLTDVLKDVINDDYSKIKIQNEKDD